MILYNWRPSWQAELESTQVDCNCIDKGPALAILAKKSVSEASNSACDLHKWEPVTPETQKQSPKQQNPSSLRLDHSLGMRLAVSSQLWAWNDLVVNNLVLFSCLEQIMSIDSQAVIQFKLKSFRLQCRESEGPGTLARSIEEENNDMIKAKKR